MRERDSRYPVYFDDCGRAKAEPYDNGQNNTCQNKNADDFIAETPSDLMFLRLPAAHAGSAKAIPGPRYAGMFRGGGILTARIEPARHGAATETKSQYPHLLGKNPTPGFAYKNSACGVEDGLLTRTSAEPRGHPPSIPFLQDFSELTGIKAVITTV
jgi:hypothetical protein